MSRIADTFRQIRAEHRTGLVTYVTAGDPSLEVSAAVIRALDAGGADVIELGVPFSDPLADGPVIQRASERALAAGGSLRATLRLLEEIRPAVGAPIVLFTYVNPALRLGLDRFADRAAAAGADGVLVLDLPLEEAAPMVSALGKGRLDFIPLLSPTSSPDRIERAAALGSGFLYCISRLGVTGARATIAASAEALVRRVRSVSTLPIAVGFGISTPDHVHQVGAWADAAVVGSALVRFVEEHRGEPGLGDGVAAYVRALRAGGGLVYAAPSHS